MIWTAVKQLADLSANTEQYVGLEVGEKLFQIAFNFTPGWLDHIPLNMCSKTQIHN